MTDPVRYLVFLQEGRDGWREFSTRDDIDEERSYWAVRSDGGAEWVSPWDSSKKATRSRFADDEERSKLPGFSILDPFGVRRAVTSTIRNNPLAGSGNGREVSAQASAAIRRYLAQRGYDGAGITNENALQIAEEVQRTEVGAIEGEDPQVELLRGIIAKVGEDEGWKQFSGMFKDSKKAEIPLQKLAGILGPNASGRSPEDLAAQSQQDPSFNPDRDAGGSLLAGSLGERVLGADRAKAAAAGQTGGSSGLGLDSATTAKPSDKLSLSPKTPGVGPDGIEVTSDVLDDYLDSNWRLVFNGIVKSFKDAGGAAIFTDWLSQQALRYFAEYEGEAALQALSGQVPSGRFIDFMEKKAGKSFRNQRTADPNAVPTADFQSFTADRNAAAAKAAVASTGAAQSAQQYTPPEPMDEVLKIAFGPQRPSGV